MTKLFLPMPRQRRLAQGDGPGEESKIAPIRRQGHSQLRKKVFTAWVCAKSALQNIGGIAVFSASDMGSPENYTARQAEMAVSLATLPPGLCRSIVQDCAFSFPLSCKHSDHQQTPAPQPGMYEGAAAPSYSIVSPGFAGRAGSFQAACRLKTFLSRPEGRAVERNANCLTFERGDFVDTQSVGLLHCQPTP